MSRPTITDAILPKLVRGTVAWHNKMNEKIFDQALDHFKKQQQEQNGWPEMPGFTDEPEW
jgi:hypothetical protein